MTSWKDENGNTVIKNTYDKEGRVTKQVDANKGEATLNTANSQLQQLTMKEIKPFISMMNSIVLFLLLIQMVQPVKRVIMQRTSWKKK